MVKDFTNTNQKRDTLNAISTSTLPNTQTSGGISLVPGLFMKEKDAHLKEMKFTSELTQIQLKSVCEMISDNSAAFSCTPSAPVVTPFVKHIIDTGNKQPISCAPYRTGPKEREAISKQIKSMLDDGIIRPSTSPWAAGVVLVAKKDGSLRFCIDYRKLNAITTKDVYPLPRIDDTIDAIGPCTFYTTLDLAAGYWQIELDEEHKAKTAFISHEGLFEFNRMPFGLTNAPATFSRMMQAVLAGLQWQSCLVYLDDIIIFSKTFEDHLSDVDRVLKRLIDRGLSCKAKKCELFRSEVIYLGHKITKHGVSADPAKIKAITEMPEPENLTQLRSFVGCCSYYRRLIKKFAKIAAPLTTLMKKDVLFNWGEDCQKSFDQLRKILSEDIVMQHPDFSQPFIIQTDASGDGISAVLSQRDEKGVERIVCCASRTLNNDEKKWSIPHLEALAIIWGCETYRPYVIGQKFTVETDHGSLRWLLETTQPGRLSRWALRLQEFDFEIKHRPGKSNGNADGFSRLPVPLDSEDQESPLLENFDKLYDATDDYEKADIPLFAITRSKSLQSPVFEHIFQGKKDLMTAQREDENISQYIRYFETGELPKFRPRNKIEQALEEFEIRKRQTLTIVKFQRTLPLYCMENGLLYFKAPLGGKELESLKERNPTALVFELPEHWRIVVPEILKIEIMRVMHNAEMSAHTGAYKTLQRIRQSFYWKTMRRDVNRWVAGCLLCACRKSSPKSSSKHGLLQNIITGQPWQTVSIDILGPLPKTDEGYTNIIVMVDHFTNWVEMIPLKNIKSETVVNSVFDNWIARYGCPKAILTDQGTNFESNLFKHICKRMGIKKLKTTAYHPQTNSKVERLNRFIAAGLSMYVNKDQKNWAHHLQAVAFAYRTSAIEFLNESPYFMVFGRDPILPLDVLFGKTTETAVDVNKFKFERSQSLKNQWKKIQMLRKSLGEKNKKYYDLHQEEVEFPITSLVTVYTPYVDPLKVTVLDEDGNPVLTPSSRNSFKSVSRKQKLSLLWKGPYRVIEKNSDINFTVAHTVTGKTLRVHVKRMRAYKPYMVDNFREIIDSDGSHMRTYEEDLFQSQQGGFQLASIHVTSNPCFEMRTLKLKKGGNVTNYARLCVNNAYECEI